MDYKEKYEQAMFRMNKWVEGSEIIDPKQVAEFVFPELKESEDERMRNVAINACKYMVDNFENSTKDYEDAIDWLEKQGEQKPAWSEEDENEYNHTLKILKLVAVEQETNGYNNLIGSINWLKSLKERMKGE